MHIVISADYKHRIHTFALFCGYWPRCAHLNLKTPISDVLPPFRRASIPFFTNNLVDGKHLAIHASDAGGYGVVDSRSFDISCKA